jgi:hypothetical protein
MAILAALGSLPSVALSSAMMNRLYAILPVAIKR